MTLNGEMTVGDLVTILSVLISASALAYSWRKDRELRRKEYADRIRRAASTIAAKLDRWPILVGRFFDDIQPLFLDLDHLTAHGEATDAHRRALERGLFEKRALASQRIAEEGLESAYVDLYGYDPRIHLLFFHALNQIKDVDERTFRQLRALAMGKTASSGEPQPGEPWDLMRRQAAELAFAHERETEEVVNAFRAEVLKLIEADDEQILKRTVALSPATRQAVEEAREASVARRQW